MYNYGFQMPQSNMDWIMVQNVAGVDSATITPSGAGANVQFAIPWIIRKPCGCNSSNLSLTISAGATITNVTMIVEGGK